MTSLPAKIHQQGKGLAVFIDPPDHNTMLGLIAQLALHQPVRVVVGGNRYRAFRLARMVRRQTVQLTEVLDRIEVARPFTCYQVVALFAQKTAVAQPLVVLDLLDTFADENITTRESYRLVRLVIQQLLEIRTYTPVIMSIAPPPQPDRSGLVKLLTDIADIVIAHEQESKPITLSLFQEVV